MPKSSIDSLKPMRAEPVQRGLSARCGSSMIALSVISRQKASAGTLVLDQQRVELLRQVLVEQVARRQVDRQRQRQPFGRAASRQWRAASSKTHIVSMRMKPVCSANGMNCIGGTSPRSRVLPAHQRLGTDHQAGVQRSAWVAGTGAARCRSTALAQLGQQRQCLRARGVDRRRRTSVAPSLALLGGVHRHLGAAEQRVGVGRMFRPAGHADAGAHVDGVFFER